MDCKIRFGPAGNSDEFYNLGYKHTYQAADWLAGLGLSAFEYSFGKGVRLSQETAHKIRDCMQSQGILVSAHAPYFVNYGNPDPDKISNSHNYVLQAVQAVQAMGGNRVVVHSGVQSKDHKDRRVVLDRVATNVRDMVAYLDEHTDGNWIVCPETMGKYSQIGNPAEVFELCTVDKRLVPCIDWGHTNCIMQGGLRTVEDFKAILDMGISVLGRERIQYLHVHFSKIQYGKLGEIKHLTFADTEYGPDYQPFVQAIVDYGLQPNIICESDGTQANDVKVLMEYYNKIAI
jgi:deoxyribonuclease-4